MQSLDKLSHIKMKSKHFSEISIFFSSIQADTHIRTAEKNTEYGANYPDSRENRQFTWKTPKWRQSNNSTILMDTAEKNVCTTQIQSLHRWPNLN